MTEYDRAIALAKRLIQQKGDLCVWNKRNGIPYSVYICFVSQGNTLALITSTLDPESAQDRGKYDAIMPTVNFVPEQGDLVTRSDGTQLIVGPMNEFKPGSQVVLYLLKFGK